MTDNEKWIDELRNQIVEEDDKILFNETVGCFLTGHYRAAYILSWITIIESLKRKINLFSNLGDSRATNAIKEIEETEDKKLSTDRLIFEESKKCGIIDNADLSTINYLWEQRCLFAHPYNKQPEIDEVQHIIGQSIKLVLGRQLLYNKDFLTNLSDNIASKPFFLPNEIEKVREFAIRTITRTPKDLHPFFFKTLLFKVGEIINMPEKFYELRKLRYYLVELFANTELNLADQKWSLEDRVTKFPYECMLGFVHQDIWQKLPDRIKEMLTAYVVNENNTNKLINLKAIVVNLIVDNKLEESLKQKYYSKLNRLDFNSAINFYGDTNSKYDRIIVELESWEFERQNPVIDYLKSKESTDFLNSLNESKQFYLGRILKACASCGNWKSQYLISDIVENRIVVSDEFKAGIAMSCFINREEKYHLDKEFVIRAIKLLNSVNEDIQQRVYISIIKVLQENKPNEFDKKIFSQQSLISLSKTVYESIDSWVESNKIGFDSLIKEISNHLL